MSNIYFTSDTHFGHANISGKNQSKWKGGYRNYESLHEMNKDIISNINKLVKPEDTLYHLGDWSFGGIENIWKFRKQINCQNIHLILGNHDHHIEENKIIKVNEEDQTRLFELTKLIGYDVPTKHLFSSVSHYKEIKVDGKMIVLSHYAHRIWHGSHKGWLHFYGHSHNSLPPSGKSHDVGIDVAIKLLGEARPFHSQEIIQIVDNLPVEFVDHHNKSTNTGKPQTRK